MDAITFLTINILFCFLMTLGFFIRNSYDYIFTMSAGILSIVIGGSVFTLSTLSTYLIGLFAVFYIVFGAIIIVMSINRFGEITRGIL